MNTCKTEISIISDMQQNKAERLCDFVSRIMNEKGLSGYDVEKNARQKGFEIDQSYVNRIKNDYIKRPSADKLQSLAAGLDEPEEIVFAIVRGTSLEPSDFDEKVKVALIDAKEFNPTQQEELLAAVRRFVAGIRAENARKANS